MPYKIRRKSDGKFSQGGGRPRFNDKGKVWGTLGQLKSHLALGPYYSYNAFEIVEVELIEKSVTPLDDFMQKANEVRQEKKRKQDAAAKARWVERELKLIRELAQKYGAKVELP